jgi:hypothetical protein
MGLVSLTLPVAESCMAHSPETRDTAAGEPAVGAPDTPLQALVVHAIAVEAENAAKRIVDILIIRVMVFI